MLDGKLIAGGLSTAGEVVSDVAAWDGNTWSALGAGTGGHVQALTVFDGRLIAGGTFATAGEVAADHVAAWDGNSWSALGTGVLWSVPSLTVYGGNIIAGQ